MHMIMITNGEMQMINDQNNPMYIKDALNRVWTLALDIFEDETAVKIRAIFQELLEYNLRKFV